ncbi:MAG TPA: molybdenum cofactor guanylyltransferase [Polyangiales bacterium]
MIVGIFVGGRSSRMGGVPKGLLPAPDSGEPLVVRSVRIIRQAGHTPVLVGAADAYHAALPDLSRVADEPAGVGPLGGLNALLRAAGRASAIAIACDMPFVSSALLKRLAAYPSTAPVLAARNDAGKWEPLCARYDAERVRPVLERALERGGRSFQGLLARVAVEVLELGEGERTALLDWDTPEDVTRC